MLFSAIRDGLALLTWEKDSFAYAEDFDETASSQGLSHHGEGIPDLAEQVLKSARAFVADRKRSHHPRVLSAFEQFAESGQLNALYV